MPQFIHLIKDYNDFIFILNNYELRNFIKEHSYRGLQIKL
jgi:hypothetical protein